MNPTVDRRTEGRWRQGSTRLGLPFDTYRRYMEAGFRWCSRDQCWEPSNRFGPHIRRPDGLDTCCLESSRRAAREWQRAKRARTKVVTA